MHYSTLKVVQEKDVLTIELNRPDVHNAMNEELMTELTTSFRQINANENIRIVILTGSGSSFCSGADLNWMKNMVNFSKKENIEDSKKLLRLYEAIVNCSKPVIGKINGHAFGGGIGLVAVCDITIALPEKKFAFSETKLGIIPSVISTFVARRVNLATMNRLFITGERFSSEYAQKIGLIDNIVDETHIDKTVQKYISLLRSSGPQSIAEIKSLLHYYQLMDIEKYKEHTVEKIAELRLSHEGQEGISAFLKKRKSKWSEE
jgi:methylglutaconyl-CoA hydratase